MTDPRALHILVVDDDDVDVMTVRRALEKARLTNPIHIAADGEEALAILRSGVVGPRRIVLLDLNMPRMTGIEFLQELRADPVLHTTAVVVLTTSNEERDKVEAFRLHVAGYLVKPVTFANFVDLMATLNKYWTLVEMP